MIFYFIILCTLLPKLNIAQTEKFQNDEGFDDSVAFGPATPKFVAPEFEMLLPNGQVYTMPFNPARRKLRGIPFRNASVSGGTKFGRVVGGKEEDPGALPYQVAIMFKGFGLACGGSIYRNDTIITAAHCFFDDGVLSSASDYLVVAGTTSLLETEEFEQLRTVEKVIVHGQYVSGKAGLYDIALMILKEPLCFNPHIQPIPIAEKGFIPRDQEPAKVSGWGYTVSRTNSDALEMENYSKTLKSATLQIMLRDKCVRTYAAMGDKASTDTVAHETILCAGLQDEMVDACQGDSGGPLACVDNKNKVFLCGIISTGVGCALPNIPSLYVNIAVFHDWIIQKAGMPGESCVASSSNTTTPKH